MREEVETEKEMGRKENGKIGRERRRKEEKGNK